jgi:hypothetical protein
MGAVFGRKEKAAPGGGFYEIGQDSRGPRVRSLWFRIMAVTCTILRIGNETHFKVMIAVCTKMTRGKRGIGSEKCGKSRIKQKKGACFGAPTNPIYQICETLST